MGRKVKKGKKNCGKKKCKVEKSEVNEEKGEERIVEKTVWLDCFGEGKAVDPVAAEFCSIFQDLQCNKLSEKQVKVSEEIVRENNSTDELVTNKAMDENIEEFGDNDGKVGNREVNASDFLNACDETTKEVHDMEPIEIELEETLIEDLKQIRDVDDQLSFLTVDITYS